MSQEDFDNLKIENEEEDEVDDENIEIDAITGKDLDTNELASLPKDNSEKDSSSTLEAEEEEEGETRCICGELDPPDELGLYIQCEKCGVWQHGFCIGILTEKETPDKYWCEMCKPNLHNIYLNDLGERKSLYKPIQDKKRQRKRNNRLQQNNRQNSTNNNDYMNDTPTRTSTPTESSNSSKEYNELESKKHGSTDQIDNELEQESNNKLKRDDDYDNLTNPHTDNIQNTNNTTSKTNNSKNNKPDKNSNNSNSSSKKPDTASNPSNRESTDTSTTSYDENDKRFQDRKRATFLAREEKQYQRMLQKAILESKRSNSNADEMDTNKQQNETKKKLITTTVDTNKNNDTIETQGTEEKKYEENLQIEENKDSTPPITNDGNVATEQEPNLVDVANSVDQPSKSSSPVLKRTASLKSLKNQRRSKRTKRSKSNGSTSNNGSNAVDKPAKHSKRNANNSHRDKNDNSNSNEIDINKPVKPRLPPSRTTINEMSRRVSAILEFISRTQWELSQDQQTKEDLIKFVENDEFLVKIDDIYNSFNDSLTLMDNLTRNLLIWEKKYTNSNSNNNC